MASLARLAVGTVQPGASSTALVGALAECLRRCGANVQQFHSRAALADSHSECATGGRARHLDSWLMDAATCREVFAHGTPAGGLGLVDGAFEPGSGRTPPRSECLTPRDSVWPASTTDACARLETLCRWLDLPRLVLLDAALLNVCHLPSLPADTNGLLLVGLENVTAAARLETQLSALWGVPVLGWLDRATMSRYSSAIRNSGSSEAAYCQAMLADSLERSLKIDALIRLTTARRWPDVPPRLFRQRTIDRSPCIAIAHDEVFDGYFQETLDLLELHGARLEVFSPLRDEALPAGTDVVYIGGGSVERHAAALAENTCMTLALREHLCQGRRIYGEGGGTAYLCQQIELPYGTRHPMVGALPAIARYRDGAATCEPVEITLVRDNWLGEGWSRIRGYRNRQWDVQPNGSLIRYAAGAGHETDLVGRHQAVGSLIHLNFAAQPEYLESFLQPHAPALDTARMRRPMPAKY